MVTAGSAGSLDIAKKSFTNAFIGLIIILSAWLIVDTLMRGLIGGNGDIKGYGPWTDIKCASQAAVDEKRGFFDVEEYGAGDTLSTDTYNNGAGIDSQVMASIGKGNTAIVAYAQKMDAQNCQYSQAYRNGCRGNPGYTDCSDLVNNAYRAAGCTSPGPNTLPIYHNPKAIPVASAPLSTLQAGDAIVYRYKDNKGVEHGHIVTCMSAGCTQVIHASTEKSGIKVSNSSSFYGRAGAKVIRASDFCK
jgi:hypothetical protein